VSSSPAPSRRALTWWFGLMLLGGLAFGLNADRRPFGNDMLAHPLIVFFALAAAGLLVLRAALRRPVPEILPERMLIAGCAIGVAAYLTGNWIAANIIHAAMLTPHQG
jgi:MYXO-CTERM domain-containing protein